MLDQLRDRFAARLAHHHIAVLCTPGQSDASGQGHAWAIPVYYRSDHLDMRCLVPHWADVAYYLEQDPRVMIIVQSRSDFPLCWLQYQGLAHPASLSTWQGPWPEWLPPAEAEARYLLLHVTPTRIDWMDGKQGWGVQETLETGLLQTNTCKQRN